MRELAIAADPFVVPPSHFPFRKRGFLRDRKDRKCREADEDRHARKGARIRVPRPGEDGSSKGMFLGYARVSTIDQNLALQRDELAEAGCGGFSPSGPSGWPRRRTL
jgi:hypothetical protein